MADQQQFTLHRRAWHLYRRLPRLARIWVVLVAIGAPLELALHPGPSEAQQRVEGAVEAAVRQATGADPASSCSALSPAGLHEVLSQFGTGESTAAGASQLAACEDLVPRLRVQASAQELTDFEEGSVRSVQFRPDGSALVIYAAANHAGAAELTLSEHSGRWLIDSVEAGQIAGAG